MDMEMHSKDEVPKDPRARYLLAMNPRRVEFLQAKGIAFRALWAKRLKRGMKLEDVERFDKMVAEFHNTEAP